ncbi:WYL domain-containing protein [Dickeya undicola]|uniref:WYL domain-containing protein n=1 Tax=Dickeya undicola TaxID=1577887 RepID=UPI003F296ED5
MLLHRQQRKTYITSMDQYGVVSKRITWSIVLGFVAPWCFIVGWCELRQNFRLFRADRITHAEFLNDRYSRSRFVPSVRFPVIR